MSKLLKYELKRLICNKFFLGLALVTLCYAYYLFTSEILPGVSHTAPFSPWSYGYYLAKVSPLLCVAVLFFLTFFTSAKEQKVTILTASTPIQPAVYRMIRLVSVLTATCILSFFVAVLPCILYQIYFDWTAFATLLYPAVFVLIPSLLLILGAGWCLGRIHPALIYVCMMVVLLLNFVSLPAPWDASGYLLSTPLSAAQLDPDFAVSGQAAIIRGVYSGIGLLLLSVSLFAGKWLERRKKHG